MKTKKITKNLLLFIPLFILIIISLCNMYKAGIEYSNYNNYFIKQSIWFLCGFFILIIVKFLKPQVLFKYSKYLYYFNIILLILVLFFGKSINGSRAWFSFGLFSFQPSELMKFSLCLYLSESLSIKNNNSFKDQFKYIATSLILTLIPSFLVFLEPDTGAILIYFIILLGNVLIFKINKKWYIWSAILLIIFLSIFSYLYFFNSDLFIKIFGTSFFYRIDRILTFVNKDGFQLDRALITIASSSLFTTGKKVYIPEAPTDFIIAYSIGNFGIISFIFILISFFLLNYYFIKKAINIKNKKYKMFLLSFTLMLILAELQNIGMNLGLLPIIGLPLPFVSYGGTNIIVYFLFLGVIINLKE